MENKDQTAGDSLETILNHMRSHQRVLCLNADIYIRHMLNGKKKTTISVIIWGPDTVKITYKSDMGKRGFHIVNQKQFLKKVAFYSRNKSKDSTK